jgi:CRP/FNR family transcriptional regulator, dissimilatory nitrate respiration regulator
MIKIIMLPPPFQDFDAQSMVRVAKGGFAFRQDDVSKGPYYLARGSVALVRHTETGHQVVVHRAREGETLAEASLFSPHYHCDCLALQDSDLLRLDKNTILQQIKQNPDFAMLLLQRFSGQVQAHRRQLEILAIKGAEDRVLAALAEFGQSGSVMGFASTIGLSHESTYRALSALVRRGLVKRFARGKYRLNNVPQ